MQVQDSNGEVELPALRQKTSAVFCEEWRTRRRLKIGKCVPKKPSPFLPIDSQCPAFIIVNHDRDGKERIDLSRTRYDTSHPACPKDEKGNPIKYRLDGKPGYSPVFAPLPDSYAKFAVVKEKWIAEGEGQSLALAELSLPVLGIGGCSNWRVKGTDDLSQELGDIHPGDTVMIAGDGDVRTNAQVRNGYVPLMNAIRKRGASPFYVLLPESGGPKDGVDDCIARCKNEGNDPLAMVEALPKLPDLGVLDDFPLTSYDDLLARPFPEWIIEGLIQPNELTAIVGATSCGKSFLVQDMLASVAQGLPHWFGYDINTSGVVVHITMEGRGLDNRMKAYKQHHKPTKSFPYLALERSVSFLDPQEVEKVIRTIKHAASSLNLPVTLIAIDTVNRALGGGDENGADMGGLIRAADRVRDAFVGAGILLVHHFGKDPTKGARGNSSFSCNIGAELTVENKNGLRTVTVLKQRDGKTTDSFNFRLQIEEIGKNRKGKTITSCVVVAAASGPVVVENSHDMIYGWVYTWWKTQYHSAPVTKNVIKEQFKLIADGKAKRDEVTNSFLWAENEGLLTIVGEVKKHPTYVLAPCPPKKYQ